MIRQLSGDGTVAIPTVEVEGYYGLFALGTVFGVSSHPPTAIADKLKSYRACIESGTADEPEAVTLRDTLRAHFGASHPAMLEREGGPDGTR